MRHKKLERSISRTRDAISNGYKKLYENEPLTEHYVRKALLGLVFVEFEINGRLSEQTKLYREQYYNDKINKEDFEEIITYCEEKLEEVLENTTAP